MKTSSLRLWAYALCLLVCVIIGSPAHAQATFAIESEILSNYVTPNGVSYGDTVSQTEITASWNNGIYAYVWLSGGIADSKNPYSNEADFGLGYEFVTAGLDFDVGVEFQDLSNKFGDWDMWVPFLEVSKTFKVSAASVTPFIRTEGWYSENKADNGWITSVGVRIEEPLNDKWKISGSAAAVHDPGVFGGAAVINADFGVALDYQFDRSASIGVSGRYVVAGGGDLRDNEGVIGLHLKITDVSQVIKNVSDRLRW